MPDAAKGFEPKNKADGCCDYCCVPCSEARCIQDGTCTCGNTRLQVLSKSGCGRTNVTGYTTDEGLRAGEHYVNMVRTVKSKLDQIGTKGIDYNIAGFVWFQGWSDATKQPDWVEDECNRPPVEPVRPADLYKFADLCLPPCSARRGEHGGFHKGRAHRVRSARHALHHRRPGHGRVRKPWQTSHLQLAAQGGGSPGNQRDHCVHRDAHFCGQVRLSGHGRRDLLRAERRGLRRKRQHWLCVCGHH